MPTPKSLLAEARGAVGDTIAKTLIENAMRRHRGNQNAVADDLGIDRRLLSREAKRAGIDWAALVAESTGSPTKAA